MGRDKARAFASSRLSMLGRRALVILCVRVCLALLTDTFFQPDEFYQSLEVAHHVVFGYGYVTWEWASERPVRSPVYPALYAIVYQLIKSLKLDNTRLLVCRVSLREPVMPNQCTLADTCTEDREWGVWVHHRRIAELPDEDTPWTPIHWCIGAYALYNAHTLRSSMFVSLLFRCLPSSTPSL